MRVRAATCPGTSRPRRTYVSGRSTGTGFTGTWARILTAASQMTRRGKRGGVTLRSCHQGAMTCRVGRLADGLSCAFSVAPKTAHRYYKRESLHAVFHGGDVIVCLSSNRETHRWIWQNKTCARHGEDRGGGKGEGGGGGVGGNHHGTRTTGVSCRRRLLRMRASVVVQDHAVRLPSGGPQLRVLLVSGVVRQCRAPDPEGQTADDTGGPRGQRGAAEAEGATGAGKVSGR